MGCAEPDGKRLGFLSDSPPKALVCADAPPVICSTEESTTILNANYEDLLVACHLMLSILAHRIQTVICPLLNVPIGCVCHENPKRVRCLPCEVASFI